mgnify:CR=1 FL=1
MEQEWNALDRALKGKMVMVTRVEEVWKDFAHHDVYE